MSSSRTLLALAVCVVLSGTLAGCGFEPLHGKRSASSATALETVRISIIEDREGQLLRNYLLRLLSPRGSVDPQWALRVTLSESEERILVEESSFATRANLRVQAQYEFRQLHTETSELPFSRSGNSLSVGSYNILGSEFEYANVVAERDAREKAIRVLADDIKRRVSLWLREASEAGVGSGG